MRNQPQATKDHIIEQLIKDKNYIIKKDGTVLTYVSEQGHITNKLRIKKLYKNKEGYFTISYYKHNLFLHRVLYAKFIGKLNSFMTINHLNGNRSDNDLENLEMVSIGENNRHRYRVSDHLAVSGAQKLSQEDVEKIRLLRKKGFKHEKLSIMFNTCKSNIFYIVNNRTFNKTTTRYKHK